MKKFFVFIIVLFIVSCLPIDTYYPIWIKNNSNKDVYFFETNMYPDTLLPNTNINVVFLKKGDKEGIGSTHPWDETFSAQFPSDTLLIYYFDSDTISKYSWEEIRSKHKILRKNLYSKQDLMNTNWTITYP